jgi:hypothetical protein
MEQNTLGVTAWHLPVHLVQGILHFSVLCCGLISTPPCWYASGRNMEVETGVNWLTDLRFSFEPGANLRMA